MTTKTITLKNLIEEINKLGFSEEDQVVLLANEEMVTIKKLPSQTLSMFSSQYCKPKASVSEANQFSDESKFRDFASPIWEEAKNDNLTLQDIDDIVHQVRKVF
jgi:hypothetical protein